jgi:hypothetical protein
VTAPPGPHPSPTAVGSRRVPAREERGRLARWAVALGRDCARSPFRRLASRIGVDVQRGEHGPHDCPGVVLVVLADDDVVDPHHVALERDAVAQIGDVAVGVGDRRQEPGETGVEGVVAGLADAADLAVVLDAVIDLGVELLVAQLVEVATRLRLADRRDADGGGVARCPEEDAPLALARPVNRPVCGIVDRERDGVANWNMVARRPGVRLP